MFLFCLNKVFLCSTQFYFAWHVFTSPDTFLLRKTRFYFAHYFFVFLGSFSWSLVLVRSFSWFFREGVPELNWWNSSCLLLISFLWRHQNVCTLLWRHWRHRRKRVGIAPREGCFVLTQFPRGVSHVITLPSLGQPGLKSGKVPNRQPTYLVITLYKYFIHK